MNKMNELTVLEIAEKKKMNFSTVKAQIKRLGIKEIRKVGRTNVYAPEILDLMDPTTKVGWPTGRKKSPDTLAIVPKAAKPARAKKAKKTKK